jgi:O-sialoglycoprotein endopeptidase (EC 3.4.24.57)
MTVLGETIDDAVGEAFDKSAKILGLPYPGGPLIDKYAQLGNPKAFAFTKPKVGPLDFSFSGLKTAILYFIQKEEKKNPNFIKENLHNICASIQHTIVEILMDKLKNTVKKTRYKTYCHSWWSFCKLCNTPKTSICRKIFGLAHLHS